MISKIVQVGERSLSLFGWVCPRSAKQLSPNRTMEPRGLAKNPNLNDRGCIASCEGGVGELLLGRKAAPMPLCKAPR